MGIFWGVAKISNILGCLIFLIFLIFFGYDDFVDKF